MGIFLGKFSNKYPEQIEKKYYASGKKGGPWYGGVEPGDYVFASYEGKIVGLWRAKEYTNMKNNVNQKDQGVLLFNEIKAYENISTSNDFTRYKHFIHDLNLVNKVTKSVKNLGFIPIKTTADCPAPEDIEFRNNSISIYIAIREIDLDYKERDIRVTINNTKEMKIESIERFIDGQFTLYKDLYELYDEKSTEEGRYTIMELKNYAIKDKAPNKLKFLTNLIDELENNGFMKVSNPISLYDNLLVGRKRSYTPPGKPGRIGPAIEPDDEDIEGFEDLASLLIFNPNLILYGPPGTGKTYSTRKIIDTFERRYFSSNSSIKLAEEEGRLRNITFHQSYSYEEFIEGIRPVLSQDQTEKIGYRLENGIFKEHSINAEKELIKREGNIEFIDTISSGSVIWKVSLGRRNDPTTYKQCLGANEIAIDYPIQIDIGGYSQDEILDLLEESGIFKKKPIMHASNMYALANEMAMGDIVMVYDSPKAIRMIGVISGDYYFDEGFDNNRHRRKVTWFKDLTYPIDIYKYNGNVNLTLKTIYPLTNMEVTDVIKIISENSTMEQTVEDRNQIKPYYIIIDEINRGNISKIFGELITLIEQDKRGVFKSILPYSKKEFTVPNNLYIIGTMNTADRSIAAIDTALRRRFTFVEIEPDSKVISQSNNSIINDRIDLAMLLDAINNRILEKYDRDHRIGHSYFMEIESLKGLYQTWYYKILPLLGEYFYNDLDSLRYVVGNNFYDNYGNIKYLSINPGANGISEFEEKLLEIYQE